MPFFLRVTLPQGSAVWKIVAVWLLVNVLNMAVVAGLVRFVKWVWLW